MRIVSKQGSTALNHDGVDYKSEDGVFDVPETVGQALVRFPHWMAEHEAVDARIAKDAANQVNPSTLATRVRELEARLAETGPSESEAELLARVTELEAELAKRGAAQDPAADEAPSTARKRAAKKPTTDGE